MQLKLLTKISTCKLSIDRAINPLFIDQMLYLLRVFVNREAGMSKIDTVDTKVKKQLNKHDKRITSLEENDKYSPKNNEKDYSKGNEKSQGTTP